jgi:hypothetical protein
MLPQRFSAATTWTTPGLPALGGPPQAATPQAKVVATSAQTATRARRPVGIGIVLILRL